MYKYPKPWLLRQTTFQSCRESLFHLTPPFSMQPWKGQEAACSVVFQKLKIGWMLYGKMYYAAH
jgi:hypothetical protein